MAAASSFATGKERRDDVFPKQPVVLRANHLGNLILELRRRSYEVVGPTERDGAIVYDHIGSLEDLPVGWTDEQKPGHYRLSQRADRIFFDYAAGPQSWKKYLHPAEVRLCSAERQGKTFRILNNEARAQTSVCISGSSRLRTGSHRGTRPRSAPGQVPRPHLRAAQCRQSSSSRCSARGRRRLASARRWEPGRGLRGGFDLALTELLGPKGHRFLVESGSEHGAEVLAEMEVSSASEEDLQQMEVGVQEATNQQTRHIDTNGIKDLLYQKL